MQVQAWVISWGHNSNKVRVVSRVHSMDIIMIYTCFSLFSFPFFLLLSLHSFDYLSSYISSLITFSSNLFNKWNCHSRVYPSSTLSEADHTIPYHTIRQYPPHLPTPYPSSPSACCASTEELLRLHRKNSSTTSTERKQHFSEIQELKINSLSIAIIYPWASSTAWNVLRNG